MVFWGIRVMEEGISLLSPINLSLSQDLGRPKAIMAIYMESQHLGIVSPFLWQHSSCKNTALQTHWHPNVLSAIPLAVNSPSKHARVRKLMLTSPSVKRTARCWGTLSVWMASSCCCCLLPSLLSLAGILTSTTEGLPGEQRKGKTMPKSTLSFYVLLLSPPPLSELKNPSPRKLRWKRLKSLLPSPLLRLRNRNIS